MLNNLKNAIKQEEMSNALLESMTSATDSDVKDLFLDDISVAVLGAENDPEIKNLAQSIPEYDDHDEDVAAQVESLVESLIETDF